MPAIVSPDWRAVDSVVLMPAGVVLTTAPELMAPPRRGLWQPSQVRRSPGRTWIQLVCVWNASPLVVDDGQADRRVGRNGQLERAVGLDRRVAEDLLHLELGLADRLAHAGHAGAGRNGANGADEAGRGAAVGRVRRILHLDQVGDLRARVGRIGRRGRGDLRRAAGRRVGRGQHAGAHAAEAVGVVDATHFEQAEVLRRERRVDVGRQGRVRLGARLDRDRVGVHQAGRRCSDDQEGLRASDRTCRSRTTGARCPGPRRPATSSARRSFAEARLLGGGQRRARDDDAASCSLRRA